MAKFHVNDSGNVSPCKATKRPCRFGDEAHFGTREEAAKAAEHHLAEAFNAREAIRKARVLPQTLNQLDQDSLTIEQRADQAVFEAMKNDPGFSVGALHENYYGSGEGGEFTDEEWLELQDHNAVGNTKRKNVYEDVASKCRSIELVPGTLEEEATSHFTDTFSSSNNLIHLVADAVIELNDGHRMPVKVNCTTSFYEIINEAIEPTTPEALNRRRARNSRYNDIH